MQTITIAGKLGRDAELRTTQTGEVICNFTVAVDQREGRDKTTNWWRCSIWGKRGESLAPYLLKGAAVTVAGSMSVTEYDSKLQLNIRVAEIALQGGKQEQRQERASARAGGGGDHGSSFATDPLDDEIPFATNQGIW